MGADSALRGASQSKLNQGEGGNGGVKGYFGKVSLFPCFCFLLFACVRALRAPVRRYGILIISKW